MTKNPDYRHDPNKPCILVDQETFDQASYDEKVLGNYRVDGEKPTFIDCALPAED